VIHSKRMLFNIFLHHQFELLLLCHNPKQWDENLSNSSSWDSGILSEHVLQSGLGLAEYWSNEDCSYLQPKSFIQWAQFKFFSLFRFHDILTCCSTINTFLLNSFQVRFTHNLSLRHFLVQNSISAQGWNSILQSTNAKSLITPIGLFYDLSLSCIKGSRSIIIVCGQFKLFLSFFLYDILVLCAVSFTFPSKSFKTGCH